MQRATFHPAGHRALTVLAAVALMACADRPTPVAPDAMDARAVSLAAMDRSKTTGDADDVVDALDRIAPAFGETGPANQLRAALRQLADAARAGDDAEMRRDAALTSLALDRLEAIGDRGLGAEIDAVRLVADARK